MIVRSVEAGPFATYAAFGKCPPPSGVTVIVGENGAGKSVGGYEVLSWCLWGETVRGAKVADGRAKVMVDVRGEVYTVERVLTQRAHKLTLGCGMLDLTAATRTETQKRLDAIVGSHERFCAGRVFARDLLAKFGLATDAQRKELLEEVLGLQQFDRAQVQCVADRALADVRHQLADREYKSAKQRDWDAAERVATIKARRVRAIAEIQGEIDTVQAEHAAAREAGGLKEERLKAAIKEHAQLREDVEKAERLMAATEQNVKAIKFSIASVERGCSLCGRPFDEATKQTELTKLQANLAGSSGFDYRGLARLRAARGMLEEEVDELRAVVDSYRRQQQLRRDIHAGLKAELEIATSAAEDYADAVGVQTEAESLMHTADAARVVAQHDLVLHDACREVLGLKGARVLLLGRSLRRLEMEANVVLSRLHPSLRVAVAVNARDGVDVTVKGMGNGDYRSCSGGQRVLIDVALMLGLAAMQGGSGLLVFDEVFDSLDRRAVEAVAEYVQEIARERQVVVISHNELLTSLFRKAACWRARADGDFSVMEDA